MITGKSETHALEKEDGNENINAACWLLLAAFNKVSQDKVELRKESTSLQDEMKWTQKCRSLVQWKNYLLTMDMSLNLMVGGGGRGASFHSALIDQAIRLYTLNIPQVYLSMITSIKP